MITEDDKKRIDSLKKYLHKHFQTKNLESLKYFLGIEMARSKKCILLSQRKYILILLSEVGMLVCKSIDSSIEVNTKLLLNQGKLLEDVGRYKRLVKKLNYLTVIRHHIHRQYNKSVLLAPRTTTWR